jgi:two-component system cell cycle sensor histidine kinase/response regulator CckA
VASGGEIPSPRQKRIIQQGPLLILRDAPCLLTDDAKPIGDTTRASASIMCVPIRNGSRILGLLSIQSYKAQTYSKDDLNVLQNLADHCGAALERIKAEENLRTTAEQLRQAQKMEAIGRLAGGVAHDFNNLLTVITGYSDILLFDESLGKDRTDQLKEISAAAHRAAGLTRQLLAFSRKQKITLKPVNLNEVIEDLMKMLRRIIGEDVRLENSFAPRLPLVQADGGMMEQILMNLAVNARDAMPDGGKLFINTDTAIITPDHVRNNPEARAGEFVCLSVRDTGCGMSPEILARLFEPFFTTKDQGKGTGLGLATVYGITQQHHGWIEVESATGAGTTFKLFFPTTDRKNIVEQKNVRPKIRGGTETILLVEDDAGVRSLARHVLRRYGYNIIEAQSGVDALKVWDEVGGKVNLLLTDIVMPDGITGPDLAKRLQEKNPNLPILFTSGYSLTAIGPDVDLRDGENFLQKPYHPEKLATLVRQRLDGQ